MMPIAPLGSSPAPSAATRATPEAADPSLLKAAREFESIFVRQMLKSVEKTTAAGCGAKAAPGQSTYGSMIVDTLSDSIAKGGGLGLADVIAKSMIAAHPMAKAPGNSQPVATGSPLTGLAPASKLLKY